MAGFFDFLTGGGQAPTPGLLDAVGYMDPAQYDAARRSQGMMGLWAGLLQGGGPSLEPRNFGSALGAGLIGQNQFGTQFDEATQHRATAQAKLAEVDLKKKGYQIAQDYISGKGDIATPADTAATGTGTGTGTGGTAVPDFGGGKGGGGWGPHAPVAIETLKAAGYSDAAIAGIMANGLGEGGFKNNWQKAWGDENSFGHWQFYEKGELPGYLAFVKEQGGDPKDTRLQALYVAKRAEEVSPGFSKLTDPRAATDIFATQFERYRGAKPGQRYGFLADATRYMAGTPVEERQPIPAGPGGYGAPLPDFTEGRSTQLGGAPAPAVLAAPGAAPAPAVLAAPTAPAVGLPDIRTLTGAARQPVPGPGAGIVGSGYAGPAPGTPAATPAQLATAAAAAQRAAKGTSGGGMPPASYTDASGGDGPAPAPPGAGGGGPSFGSGVFPPAALAAAAAGAPPMPAAAVAPAPAVPAAPPAAVAPAPAILAPPAAAAAPVAMPAAPAAPGAAPAPGPMTVTLPAPPALPTIPGAATGGAAPQPQPLPAAPETPAIPARPVIPGGGAGAAPAVSPQVAAQARRAQGVVLGLTMMGVHVPDFLQKEAGIAIAGRTAAAEAEAKQPIELQNKMFEASLTAAQKRWDALTDQQKETLAFQRGLTKDQMQAMYSNIHEQYKSILDLSTAGPKAQAIAEGQLPSELRKQQSQAGLDMTTIIYGGREIPVTRQQAVDFSNGKGIPTMGIPPGAPGTLAGKPTDIGPIPEGYRVAPGPEGGYQAVPIPGTQQARALDQRQTAQQQNASVVTQDLRRAQDLVTGGYVTGLYGRGSQHLPGTDRTRFNALVSGIGANFSIDRLQQMRDASPTGGALGQVTEGEHKLLRDSYGSLDPEQGEKQLGENIARVHQRYMDIINGTPEQLGRQLREGRITKDQHDALIAQRELPADPAAAAPPPGPSGGAIKTPYGTIRPVQ